MLASSSLPSSPRSEGAGEAVAVERVSLLGSTVLLCMATLGAGMLAVPYTFAAVGYGVGLGLMGAFAALNWYAIWMLVRAGHVSRERSYDGLAAHAFGPAGKYAAAVTMQLSIFGSLTGFLVIIGDVTTPLLHHVAADSVWTSRAFVLSAITLVAILPLSLLRDLRRLEISSYAALLIIAFFSIFIVIFGIRTAGEHIGVVVAANVSLEQLFKALPILSVAFGCQLNVFSVWKELVRPKPFRMGVVGIGNEVVAATVYAFVGFFGYLLFPHDTDSNIIKQLPHSLIFDVARAVFALAIIFHYPVVHFPMRAAIDATYFPCLNFTWWRHVLVTAVVVAASLVCSLFLPNLGNVFQISGSFSAFPLNFMIPAACYLKIVNFGPRTEVDEAAPLLGKPSRRCVWRCEADLMLPTLVLLLSTVLCAISIYETVTHPA